MPKIAYVSRSFSEASLGVIDGAAGASDDSGRDRWTEVAEFVDGVA